MSSLQEVGASRSIVIDEDNIILAGNGVIEAAGIAGIENVRVIEADGNEIIAVKRKGLTPEQKTRLALWDNRAAELAEWDVEQLQIEFDAGMLDGMFSEFELADYGFQEVKPEEWDNAFDKLPEGDRAPFQQMTFTLHDDQAERIKEALTKAKHEGDFNGSENENSNGNALWWICEAFING